MWAHVSLIFTRIRSKRTVDSKQQSILLGNAVGFRKLTEVLMSKEIVQRKPSLQLLKTTVSIADYFNHSLNAWDGHFEEWREVEWLFSLLFPFLYSFLLGVWLQSQLAMILGRSQENTVVMGKYGDRQGLASLIVYHCELKIADSLFFFNVQIQWEGK